MVWVRARMAKMIVMAEKDHEQLGDELEKDAEKLARETERLEGEIERVRADWRRKQQDEGVPGAVPPEE
jgi:uncharacterized Zn finger protein